jgi:Diaphanous GTPase-binding Domain
MRNSAVSWIRKRLGTEYSLTVPAEGLPASVLTGIGSPLTSPDGSNNSLRGSGGVANATTNINGRMSGSVAANPTVSLDDLLDDLDLDSSVSRNTPSRNLEDGGGSATRTGKFSTTLFDTLPPATFSADALPPEDMDLLDTLLRQMLNETGIEPQSHDAVFAQPIATRWLLIQKHYAARDLYSPSIGAASSLPSTPKQKPVSTTTDEIGQTASELALEAANPGTTSKTPLKSTQTPNANASSGTGGGLWEPMHFVRQLPPRNRKADVEILASLRVALSTYPARWVAEFIKMGGFCGIIEVYHAFHIQQQNQFSQSYVFFFFFFIHGNFDALLVSRFYRRFCLLLFFPFLGRISVQHFLKNVLDWTYN